MSSAPPSTVHSGRRMLLVVLVLGIAVLIAKLAVGPSGPGPGAPTPRERVHWSPIATAEAQARAGGKPVLYDFSAAWCGPCRMMAEDVFADSASARAIDSLFVPVRVVDREREDGRNTPEVQALLDRFQIEAFPTLVAFDPATGRHAASTGYRNRSGTMSDLTDAHARVR